MEPSPEAIAIVEKLLGTLRNKSFSGRHPELGKMINCQICGHRHYENSPEGINCKAGQKFAHRWGLDKDNQKVYLKEELIAGQTSETETVIEERKVRVVVGAKTFAKRRKHPHSNRWLKARENHWNSKQLEYKRRMAKPLDLWDTDPKVINNDEEIIGENTPKTTSTGVASSN